MALNVDYVLRETGTNLVRNIGLTVASILTIVVALTMLGAAFLIGEGVDNATSQWKGGIEIIIFLEPEIEPAQLEAIRTSLENNPEVKRFDYRDKDEAYAEFKELFADSPEILESVTPEILPTSFRIVPVNTASDAVRAIVSSYENDAGVYRVASADETIRQFEKLTSSMSWAVFWAALILGIIAAVLIFNTIRIAMFARRREIEVMKLVGATNWFIRVPFMLEGLFQGMVGALISVVLLRVLNSQFTSQVSQPGLAFLNGFTVDPSALTSISIGMVAIGVLASVVFSAIAASLYLDV